MTPLRATLKALGMTQTDLAAELGVSQGTVSRWANSNRRLPRYATAYLEQRERRMLYSALTDAMTSPYLDTPTRSLEQLRDELRAQIAQAQALIRGAPNTLDAYTNWQTAQITKERLAAVEAEIAARSKTC